MVDSSSSHVARFVLEPVNLSIQRRRTFKNMLRRHSSDKTLVVLWRLRFDLFIFYAALVLIAFSEAALVGASFVGRAKRLMPPKSQQFLVKFAMTECKIPSRCWNLVEQSLLAEQRIRDCPEIDFYEMLHCFDQVIMARTNITDLTSKAGSVCCERIADVSAPCRAACRGALYAPTLSPAKKYNRIHTICDRSEAAADSSVLSCLETTADWLQAKF